MALEVTLMKNRFKTLKSCRTCMASEEKMNDIFSSQHNGIAIKIQYCTGLVVTKNDELPSLICDKCLQNLVTAYYFKTTSLHADKSLRDLLLNSKKEETEEIEMKTIIMEDLEPTTNVSDNNKRTKPMDNLNCNYSNDEKDVQKDDNLKDSIDVDQNDVIYNYLSIELVHDDFNLSFDDEEIKKDSNESDYLLNDDNIRKQPDFDTKHGIQNIIPTEEKGFLKSNLRQNKNIQSADSKIRAAEMKIQSLPGVTVVKQENRQEKLESLNCHQCKEKFTTLGKLKLHKNKMHSRNGKNTATSVSTVIRQSLSHMKPSCLLCFIKFNSVEELEQHRIEMHNSKENVTSSKGTKVKQSVASVKCCIPCNIKFKTIRELRKHMKENSNFPLGGTFCTQVEPTLTLTCFLCNVKFNTVMEIHKHWTEKHTQENKKSSAMTNFTNQNKLRPLCIPCNRKFDTINELQKHTKENHSKSSSKSVPEAAVRKRNNTLNTCSECDIKFDSVMKYHQHRKEKHNQEGEGIVKFKKPIRSSLKCIPCNLNFNTKKEKRKHVRTTCIMSSQDGCMCEVCGKLLRSRMSLYTHALTHAPAAHACPHCPYRAALLFDLRKHMHVHTGEKNYKCKLCTRAFATSSNLRLHERRWHTKEHRHQCQSCPKSFYDISSLKRHSTSHSGVVKQFQCDYCSSQFMHRNHWRRHVLSQHNVQVPKITAGRKRRNYILQLSSDIVVDANTASQKPDSVKSTAAAPDTN